MHHRFKQRIEDATGRRIASTRPLSGGCVGEVHAVTLDDGSKVVAKVDAAGGAALAIEARMLEHLAQRSDLPVPAVLASDGDLLVMDFVESAGGTGPDAERHAADLLADLHAVTADRFGLEFDTLIGGLHQPNDPSDSWIDFFRDRRLIEMGRQCVDAGRAGPELTGRLRALGQRLPDLIDEPDAPSLVHGDVWAGNVLARDGRIAAFIDPAIYHAHPEVELAFITLFATFGRAFFDRYHERRPIRPGFFETRRDVYNLYPLLVHTRLFGGAYAAQVDATLSRFGV